MGRNLVRALACRALLATILLTTTTAEATHRSDKPHNLAGGEGQAVIPRKAQNQRRANLGHATPRRGGATKEAFDSYNNPSRWSELSERRFHALPTSGQANKTPWAGSYWPVYHDSINYRWDGPAMPSPAEKYAAAFDDPGLMDRLSARYGIDSQTNAESCNGYCPASQACTARRGSTNYRCVTSWYGICHAWSPAAVLLEEPRHSVYHRGQVFKINDLKALLSLSYDQGAVGKFLSLRCNQDNTDFTTDGFGLVNSAASGDIATSCRDTNAGTFHIAIANMLGLRQQAFVEDRMVDWEVWNQPLRGYSYSSENITRAQYVSWVMNGNANGDGSGAYNQRISPDAVTFKRVDMTVSWVGESSAESDGNFNNCIQPLTCPAVCPQWASVLGWCGSWSCISRYTYTEPYDYVLELNSNGEIVGGEWLGSSKLRHPDFLWLPKLKDDDVILAERSGFMFSVLGESHTLNARDHRELVAGTYLEVYLDHGCPSSMMTCHGECVSATDCAAYGEVVGTGASSCDDLLGDSYCNQDGNDLHFNCPMNGCDGNDCAECGQDPSEFTLVSGVVRVDGVERCNLVARSSCFVDIHTGSEVIEVITSSLNGTTYMGFAYYKGGISHAALRDLHARSLTDTCDDIVCRDDWLGNGVCNAFNNRPECGWDGGDCCGDSCSYLSSADHQCSCNDPSITGVPCHDEEGWSDGSTTCESVRDNPGRCAELGEEVARHCPVSCGLCPDCPPLEDLRCPPTCRQVCTPSDESLCSECECFCGGAGGDDDDGGDDGGHHHGTNAQTIAITTLSIVGAAAAATLVGCFVCRKQDGGSRVAAPIEQVGL